MEQTLKWIGSAVIGVGIMIGLVVVAMLLLQGGVWLSAKLYPWLVGLTGFTFAVLVFVLLPNAVFSSVPKFAGSGMFIASYVFGATLWGVGVVPLAMLATLFNGLWSTLGELVLGLILTIGVRVWGLRLLEKAARQPA